MGDMTPRVHSTMWLISKVSTTPNPFQLACQYSLYAKSGDR